MCLPGREEYSIARMASATASEPAVPVIDPLAQTLCHTLRTPGFSLLSSHVAPTLRRFGGRFVFVESDARKETCRAVVVVGIEPVY